MSSFLPQMVVTLGLASSINPVGRPKKCWRKHNRFPTPYVLIPDSGGAYPLGDLGVKSLDAALTVAPIVRDIGKGMSNHAQPFVESFQENGFRHFNENNIRDFSK
jgi:hypothetical protein